MKILIDHQMFSLQQYGGISRYFANIYKSVSAQADMEAQIGMLYSPNYYLQDYPAPLPARLGRLLFKKQKKYYKWNQKYSNHLIARNRHDILHPSYYDPYFLKENKKPYVLTVHDMIHEQLPEFFDPNDISPKHKRICVENAAHIIAISEATKNDLMTILQVPDERITVIHHGFQMNAPASPKPVSPAVSPYVLFVGERYGYKNFAFFLHAISQILHEDPRLKLICAGGKAFMQAELELIRRLKLEQQILQVNPTDAELSNLYQEALAFVFPSLYEGFGLPLLEAFHHHCPVIASDTPCFREIGEDAMAYFNPKDLNSIYQAIKEVIYDSIRREELRQKGQRQLRKFPMEHCMNKTMAVYRSLL